MAIVPRELVSGTAPAIALAVALVTDGCLLVALLGADGPPVSAGAWLGAHATASAVAAVATSALVARVVSVRPRDVFASTLTLGALVPLFGAAGTSIALLIGYRHSLSRHREKVYWRFTTKPSLPFTPPPVRSVVALDGRGLAEQLAVSSRGEAGDADALYRKVLAVGRIRSSLSVEALTVAIAHPDERIRLTAYQTLDRKASMLNGEIQRLEALAASLAGNDCANAWLQVASNYWELLTLEQGEPIARDQLLDRAAAAALLAIVARPDNRNAHFTYGRVSLRQGELERARVAFERATALGMPKETTLPYLAEVAFGRRELERVGALLGRIDPAFLASPPLSEVAAQWR